MKGELRGAGVAGPAPYSIGYAEVRITPPLDVPYLGHVPRRGTFTTVNDDLWARAVCIRSDGDAALMLSVDLIGMGRGLTGEGPFASGVRAQLATTTGIPTDAIMICATHAHSTPETSGITDLPSSATPWLLELASTLVNIGAEAAEDTSPCELNVGVAVVDDVSMVRRSRRADEDDSLGTIPTMGLDRSLAVLTARKADGTQTVLVNFACHPVLLQAQPAMSADYPGAVVRELQARGVGAAMFLQGACGDVNPARGDSGSAADVARDACSIADAADRATATAQSRPAMAAGLSAVRVLLSLPKRQPPSGLAGSYRHLDDPDPLLRRRAEDAIALARKLGDPELPFTGEVQVIKIGDLAIVGLPGEPFSELGLLIKAMSPAPFTFVVGYANDYLGYFAPRREWLDGGYEVSDGPWSLVSGEGAEALVEAAVRLLHDLWSPRRPTSIPQVNRIATELRK